MERCSAANVEDLTRSERAFWARDEHDCMSNVFRLPLTFDALFLNKPIKNVM